MFASTEEKYVDFIYDVYCMTRSEVVLALFELFGVTLKNYHSDDYYREFLLRCYKVSLEEYVVIGYNTNDSGLPLFKVADITRDGVKIVQDSIADDQAQRFPHIIYTVVRKSDLWW